MEAISKQFDVLSLSLKARDAVMQSQIQKSNRISHNNFNKKNSACYNSNNSIKFDVDYDSDNDTASTVSLQADDSFSCCNSVTFATPLVTAVHERPRTTVEEKSTLFYTDVEYKEFRRQYIICKQRRRNRRKNGNNNVDDDDEDDKFVNFHSTVVTNVWEIPSPEDPSILYYSESDLQGFLDEFVRSLNKGWD